jgi:hypothetical protein
MELDIAASVLSSGLSSDKADLRWQFAHGPLQAKAGFWLESILHMACFYITKLIFPELPDFIPNDQFLLCIDKFWLKMKLTNDIPKQHIPTIYNN